MPATDRAGLDRLTGQSQAAALTVLRWPRPGNALPGQDAYGLLHACQRRLVGHGSTIIAVTAAGPGQPGTIYAEHEQLLLPAARAAGLRHLHDIMPLTAEDGRDTFTYATAHSTTAGLDTQAGSPQLNGITTLLIFDHPGGDRDGP